MLSRVANSMFWMSRYLERAENVARFIDVNQTLSLNFHKSSDTQWAPIIYTSGDHDLYRETHKTFSQGEVLSFLTFENSNPNSILNCLGKARENARTVRENLSTALWEEINTFYHMMNRASKSPSILDQPYQFFHDIKRASNAIVGVMDSTMSHGEGWNFCRLGRLLERADKTSRILDVKYYILLPSPEAVGTPLDVVQWSALLESTSALQMYRRCHGRIDPLRVVDFLTLDRDFPRSMHYCLIRAEDSLHKITGSGRGMFTNRAEQLLGRLRADFDYITVDDIIAHGLHEFVDSFQRRLNDIGEAIQDCFFIWPKPTYEQSQGSNPSQSQNQNHNQQHQTQGQHSQRQTQSQGFQNIS